MGQDDGEDDHADESAGADAGKQPSLVQPERLKRLPAIRSRVTAARALLSRPGRRSANLFGHESTSLSQKPEESRKENHWAQPSVNGPDRRTCRYLTRLSSLNIGRYIAITMIPTITPTPIIMIGSMIDVSDWIAASTSSS